jgi:hypothetical protein
VHPSPVAPFDEVELAVAVHVHGQAARRHRLCALVALGANDGSSVHGFCWQLPSAHTIPGVHASSHRPQFIGS